MLKLYLRVAVMVIICCAFLVACNKQPQQKPNLPQGKVGVIFTTLEPDTLEVMKKTIEEEAKKEKITLVNFKPATTKEELKENINKLLGEKVDVAIIQFAPGQENDQLASLIMEQGIKLISIGIMPEKIPLDGHITPDFTTAGLLQGSYLGQKLNPGDEVVIYGFETQAPIYNNIIDNAIIELEKTQINYKIKKITIDDLNKSADFIARDLLENENAKGVIFPSSMFALKGVAALDAIGRDTLVTTVGLGANKEAIDAIKQGLHDGEIDYMPQMIVREALSAAAFLIKNERWNYDITIKNGNYDVPIKTIPVRLITQENTYLLDERMALVEKKGSGNSGENPGGNTQSQGGGGPLELIIKTKEDRTIQVQIPKPIAKLEIMAKEDKGGKEGGQEGQQEGQAPLNLKIETIEGQVTEMEIPGEIAGLELKQQK